MKNKNEPVPFCLIVKSRSTTVKMPCKNLTWRKKSTWCNDIQYNPYRIRRKQVLNNEMMVAVTAAAMFKQAKREKKDEKNRGTHCTQKQILTHRS